VKVYTISTYESERSECETGSPLIMDAEDAMYLTGFVLGKISHRTPVDSLTTLKRNIERGLLNQTLLHNRSSSFGAVHCGPTISRPPRILSIIANAI